MLKTIHKYEQIYEDSKKSIIMVSVDSIIIGLNQTAASLLGYKKEELIGDSIERLNYPGEQPDPALVKAVLSNKKGGKLVLDKRLVKKNGDVFWAKLTISLIQDEEGSPSFVLGVLDDISDSIIIYNQRVYDTLRRSERLLRKAIETTAVHISVLDLDGTIIYTNKVLPGVDIEEVVGTSFFDLCSKDSVSEVKENMSLVKKSKQSIQFENNFPDEIGALHFMCHNMSAVLENDEVVGFSIISTDVSELNDVKKKLKETESLLQQALQRTTGNMTILDLNGIVVYVNNVVPGINKEDYIGSIVYNYLPEDLSQKIKDNICTIKNTKKAIQFQSEFIDPTNQKHFYIHDMSPVLMDNEVYRVSIVSNELQK